MRRTALPRSLGYTFFGLLLFVVFLYVTFPFPRLEQALIHRLESQSGCKMDVLEADRSFPLRWMAEKIQVLCPGQKQWEITSLYVELLPLPLLWGGEMRVPFRGRLADGAMEGVLTATRHADQYTFSLKHHGREVNLQAVSNGLTDKTSGIVVRGGKLSWDGTMHWTRSAFHKGAGTLAVTLEGVRIEGVTGWASSLGALPFARVLGQTHWQGERLSVDQFSAEGDEMDISSETGYLLLRQPWQRGICSLRLSVRPKGRLKPFARAIIAGYTGEGPLTVDISGPLGRPGLSVNGRTIPL